MSNPHRSDDKAGAPANSTPGRPHDSSSRQQKHEDQQLDSGSKSLDQHSGGASGTKGPKPPGPK